MQSNDVHSLLGISHKVKRPHPYQIFGLPAGEQDTAAIQLAIAEQIDRLRSLKGSADPAVWKQAAKLVTQAKAILLHPDQKAKLDARFGIVPSPNGTDPEDDPLAGLLPPAPASGVTGAPSISASTESASAVSEAGSETHAAPAGDRSVDDGNVDFHQTFDPTGMSGGSDDAAEDPSATIESPPEHDFTTVVSDDNATYAAPAPAPAPALEPAGRTYRRRRRRSWINRAIGSLAILGLIAIVGGVSYFALKGPGKIEIVRTDGQLTIRTGHRSAGGGSLLNENPQTKIPKQKRQSDGILDAPEPSRAKGANLSLAGSMNGSTGAANADGPSMSPGSMAGSSPPGSSPANSSTTSSSASSTSPTSPPSSDSSPSGPSPSDPAVANDPFAKLESSFAATPTDDAMSAGEKNDTNQASQPGASAGAQPPAADVVEAAEQSIAAARKAIQQGAWKSMRAAAENAETRVVTPEQKQTAESLFQLADLATHYREAIRRAMVGLQFGNEFDLTDTIKVLVVESSAESITIRHGAKNRSYAIDDVPLILADALAKLQLSDTSPTGRAARLAYRAVWPQSSPEHRADAADQLRRLGEVPGADPKQIADMIGQLYP